MTPIADMIETMTAEGVPMHIIVLAVRTAELTASGGKSGGSPVDRTAEKRRAYDRERQAKKRISGGCPVDNPPTPKIALTSSSPPIGTQGEEKKEAAKRKSGRGLSDDWKPSEGHYAEGEKLHRTRAQVDAKADEMRLWARANGHRAVARKLDWDATFTGWLRRDWGSNGDRNGSRPQADRSAVAGADRVLERLRQLG